MNYQAFVTESIRDSFDRATTTYLVRAFMTRSSALTPIPGTESLNQVIRYNASGTYSIKFRSTENPVSTDDLLAYVKVYSHGWYAILNDNDSGRPYYVEYWPAASPESFAGINSTDQATTSPISTD